MPSTARRQQNISKTLFTVVAAAAECREGRSNKNYRGNEGGAGGSRRISRRASASSLPCCSSGSQKNTRLNNILIPETPRVACR